MDKFKKNNSTKELDIIKFNQEFENKDKEQQKYKEKNYFIQEKSHPKKSSIDKIILKMKVAFDFIINKLQNKENPIDYIFANEELLQGTIYLLFFIGGLTLLLSGLMKN